MENQPSPAGLDFLTNQGGLNESKHFRCRSTPVLLRVRLTWEPTTQSAANRPDQERSQSSRRELDDEPVEFVSAELDFMVECNINDVIHID